MRRRGLAVSLFGIIAIAAIALGATVAAGRSPLLGLDLRGGVSVVLQPQHKVSSSILQQAVTIIDRRVNGLGVSNSSVARQGNDVVIELPGIKNSQQALSAVGATAQLYFRPVYCTMPPYQAPARPSKSATNPGKASSAGAPRSAALTASFSAAGSTSATTVPKTSTTTTPKATGLSQADCDISSAAALRTTSADSDDPKATVLLPSSADMGEKPADTRWLLGPADATGQIIKSASAAINTSNNAYQVNATLTNKGNVTFNQIAAVRNQSYNPKSTGAQPFTALEGIELDGVVESAPAIQSSTFQGAVSITGDFTSKEASDLALELNYGSLPVRFNPQQVNTVSAQIGSASLKAGLLAGLGGIILVLLYMIIYYRALGLVVMLGLGVGGALLYSILTELSYSNSLALTLSGVTGIIVSIGITVDSYVVYFERLKDEIRKGQTVRASVERGFVRAFKTVLTADLVSFLAALILYLFTVGDVRGFAFTLGLSTILDVFTAYFFIRPIVILLGRRRAVGDGRLLGIARGLGVAAAGGSA